MKRLNLLQAITTGPPADSNTNRGRNGITVMKSQGAEYISCPQKFQAFRYSFF